VTTKHTTFRLDDKTLATLQGLSEALHISRTDVLKQAMTAFRHLIVASQADMFAVLEVIKERYGAEAEVALRVTKSADGNPVAHVRINGNEPADLGARAMKSPEGDTVLLFLDPNDEYVDVLVTIGDDVLRARPRFAIGELPWPPQDLQYVIALKDLAPAVSDDVLALVKA
jgi:predicted transcriptional regulator